MMETGLNPTLATSQTIKQRLVRKIQAVPDRTKWRLGYLARMLEIRGRAFYAGKETEQSMLQLAIGLGFF
jgi:hypothetical protein